MPGTTTSRNEKLPNNATQPIVEQAKNTSWEVTISKLVRSHCLKPHRPTELRAARAIKAPSCWLSRPKAKPRLEQRQTRRHAGCINIDVCTGIRRARAQVYAGPSNGIGWGAADCGVRHSTEGSDWVGSCVRLVSWQCMAAARRLQIFWKWSTETRAKRFCLWV